MKRINKAMARKLFEEHKSFWIVPVYQEPTHWGILINKDSTAHYCGCVFSSFDTLVNAFAYYNCNNGRGPYPAYYID